MKTPLRLSEALISALKSCNGLKAILESLYLLLIHNVKEFGSGKTTEGVASHMNFEDVICISKSVFEELSKRLSVPLENASANQSLQQEILHPKSDAVEEEIIMLLRCCIASVKFLENDQYQLLGRCEFLNRILCRLCSCKNKNSGEGCKTSPSINLDIQSNLACRILEVFLDELITNKSFGKYIKFSAVFSPARENMCDCINFGYVLKVVSAHFCQSYSGLQAPESVGNIIWNHKENSATPEVSLTASVLLLIDPALASPPAFLHAHLISLISDVIGRAVLYDHIGFKLRFISCYMAAFERSVSLYHRQLPKLVKNLLSENDDSVVKSAIPGVRCPRRFESYVCPTMNEKLNTMIKEIDCLSFMMISQAKGNMVAISNNYVQENLHLLDESCRSIASLFLSFLIAKALHEVDDKLLHIIENVPPEDIYLLASILKLMSGSLLQTVLYMSSVRNLVDHKTSSEDSFLSKEYVMLIRIIDSFGQYRIKLPVQECLHDKLEAHFTRLNGSKLMFVHIAGLLSICLAGGIEILAKGCIYMMLNLMNLFFLEDGSLNFLSEFVSSGMECELPQHTPAKSHTKKVSSAELALKFKKIQLRKGSTSGFQDEEAGETMVEDESCNGTAFLNCISKSFASSPACLDEEIVNFIECRQGRDYSSWLKNRRRYRTRKSQKVADQSWEMKQATWRSARRKRKP